VGVGQNQPGEERGEDLEEGSTLKREIERGCGGGGQLVRTYCGDKEKEGRGQGRAGGARVKNKVRNNTHDGLVNLRKARQETYMT